MSIDTNDATMTDALVEPENGEEEEDEEPEDDEEERNNVSDDEPVEFQTQAESSENKPFDTVSTMPLPPTYYSKVSKPPKIPTDTTLVTFSTIPVHETYKEELERLEKELKDTGRLLYVKDKDFHHGKQLKKLNVSLLFNFFELVDTLIEDPLQYKSKVANIQKIMINMYHLMNSYRPHQARQTLIEFLKNQILERKQLLQEVEKIVTESRHVMTESSNKMTLMEQQIQQNLNDAEEANRSDWMELDVTRSVAKEKQSPGEKLMPIEFFKMKEFLDGIRP